MLAGTTQFPIPMGLTAMMLATTSSVMKLMASANRGIEGLERSDT